MPVGGLLLWLKVRLSIGLSLTDEAANTFFASHPKEEEEWAARLAAPPQGRTPAVYFLSGGTLRKGTQSEWRCEAGVVPPRKAAFMLFYPKFVTEEVGEASSEPDQAFGWVVDVSDPLRREPSAPSKDYLYCRDDFGIELGAVLETERRRSPHPTSAIGEVLFWQGRAAALAPHEAKAAAVVAKPSSVRWPVLRAQLLTASIEADRKCTDYSLLSQPLQTVANTLPLRHGLDPLWTANTPLHLGLYLLCRFHRAALPPSEAERVYSKAVAEAALQIRHYLDSSSFFTVSDDELNPPGAPCSAEQEAGILASGGATRPAPLRCVEAGRAKLDKAEELLLEWRATFDACARWWTEEEEGEEAAAWPRNTRRVFSPFDFLAGRIVDVRRVLEQLCEEQPELVEDRGGYRRFRLLAGMLQGVPYDVFDISRRRDWNALSARWERAVASKLDFPEDLRQQEPYRPSSPVAPPELNELLPISTVLDGFSPVVGVPREERDGTEHLPPQDRIVILKQEKQVLAEMLAAAERKLEEDRHVIAALTADYQKAQDVAAALTQELQVAKFGDAK